MSFYSSAFKSRVLVPTALFALLVGAAGCADDSSGTNPPDDEVVVDTDGDKISDEDEGTADADNDGTPNNEDTDSDGDGILDIIEAGDQDVKTAPTDSDSDGTPDYLDTDSDDNGISDQLEGSADVDKDGIIDSADLDNDGDGVGDVSEILGAGADCDADGTAQAEGTPESPQDCEVDGTPNYNDQDSDGDTIADSYEGEFDSDGDGFLDRYDLDSDNDGITDKDEGGTGSLDDQPLDSDGDGYPDFVDLDSDGDGLSDQIEAGAGSDPTKPDSDGDGVGDLIEVSAGTDPNDPADNPQANGDFVFVVPYQKPTDPTEDTLNFRTSIQFADLYFVIDTTGSMSEEFATLQGTLASIIDTLRCAEIPNATCVLDQDCPGGSICFQQKCIEDPTTANGGNGCVPDMWTGVGLFNDLDTYRNEISLQPNPAITAAAIDAGGFPGGSEAIYQAPACAANPVSCVSATYTFAEMNCAPSGIGCAGFRPEATRILLEVSDANNQCSGAGCTKFTPAYTGSVLVSQDIKYVALYGTDDGTGQQQAYNALALAAQSVDSMNNPYIYPAADAAVQQEAVQAVLDIVKGKPIRVTIDPVDLPGDAGDSLQFIDYLEVNVSGQNNCTMVNPTEDTDANAHDDAFPSLLPGVPVCWDVHPVPVNTTQPATSAPQLFVARLKVFGDSSLVDSRDVYFLVPPKPVDVPQ